MRFLSTCCRDTVRAAARRLRRDGAAVAILAVAWALLFHAALTGRATFGGGDLFYFHGPLHQHAVALLRAHQAPWLSTGLDSGEPLAANPNLAIFYPATLLYLVLPFGAAWNLVLAGHVLWAAIGAYVLARVLGATAWASVGAGGTFAFAGPLLSSIQYYTIPQAASWLPWILALAVLAWRRGGAWTPLAALAMGLQLLGGEPTILLITATLLLAGWLAGLLRSAREVRLARAGRGAVIAVVALLVGSVQLLPTLAWLPHATRAIGLDFARSAAWWSFHPARLGEMLVPELHGDASQPLAARFWGQELSDTGVPYLPSPYVGLLPLLVAPLAWRRSWGRVALAVSALGLVLAMGRHVPIYALLFRVLPPLHVVRYPEKFLVLVALAFSVVAAMGVSELPGTPVRRRRPPRADAPEGETRKGPDGPDRGGGTSGCPHGTTAVAWCVGVALAIAFLVLLSRMPPGALAPSQVALRASSCVRAAVVLAGLAGLALAAYASRRRSLAACLSLAALLDVAVAGHDVPPLVPPEGARARPEILDALPALADSGVLHLGPEQVDDFYAGSVPPTVRMRSVAEPLVGLPWGMRYGASEDIDRMSWLPAVARGQAMLRDFPGGAALAIARESGIGHVVSLRPVAGPGLVAVAMPPLSTGEVHVLALDPPPPPLVRWAAGTGALRWREEAPCRIVIEATAEQAARLVVGRNALPGWRATEQGALPLEATRLGFLVLPVSPGSHRIVLSYRPPGLALGASLSALGVALVATLLAVSAVREGRAAARHGASGERSPPA